MYRIGAVMVSILALSVIYRGFEFGSGQTKDYKIGICCFSSKHAKSKDWLVRVGIKQQSLTHLNRCFGSRVQNVYNKM